MDKMYIATMSYKNGILETLTDEQKELIEGIRGMHDYDFLKDVSDGAIANWMMYNYISIITDAKSFALSRQSIDTITDVLKNDILPHLKEKQSYRYSGYELLPTFLSRKKLEFATGKSGIGPFALNITNLALTLFTHLSMTYKGDENFHFGDLDESIGQDGEYIAGWLSAMINAHVDVAKDPYVFDLNVNNATYNHVNFLLRAGKGRSVFTFIAQPIIKKYADKVNNAGGMYGSNIDGRLKFTSRSESKKTIYNDLVESAKKELKAALKNQQLLSLISKDELNFIKNQFATIEGEDKNKAQWDYVFDYNKALYAIDNPNTILSKFFLYMSIKAYDRINKYAQELETLVSCSGIDTKKFGNNIASLMNFMNKYNNFKYGTHNGVTWFINEGENARKKAGEIAKREGDSYPLRKYFDTLFLNSKLQLATHYTKDLLRGQLCTATKPFADIFNTMFALINGETEFIVERYVNGELKAEKHTGYENVFDEKVVRNMADAIDNIMRYRILQKYGANTIMKDTNTEEKTGPIDFTCGGRPEVVTRVMEQLIYGNSKSDTKLGKKSLFKNLAEFIQHIQDNPTSEEAEGLVDLVSGKIKNEFLNFLKPQPESSSFPIGRMLLRTSQMNVAVEEKQTLISAFDQLLRHPSKDVRTLAREIAFYAYYSTYDQNSIFSFFDLVPPYYRQQYDFSLKRALRESTKDFSVAITPEEIDADSNRTSLLARNFLDLISRNYWYDNNIVPIYYENTDRGNTPLKYFNNFGEHRFPDIIAHINKQRVAGAIATTKVGKKKYFKIQKGDDVYLYRLVGYIQKKSDDSATLLNNSAWARLSSNGYEVSSQGDARFSALSAKFRDGTYIDKWDASGYTIEDFYQKVVKMSTKNGQPSRRSIVYEATEGAKLTGKLPKNPTKDELEDFTFFNFYLPLWQDWAKQNPDLIEDLRIKSKNKVLTDKFAKTRVNQARALAYILSDGKSEEQSSQPTDKEEEKKTSTTDKKGDKNKQRLSVNKIPLFVCTPKLGVHQGNIHQYEFVAGNSASMFDNNDLPDNFTYDNVMASVNRYVEGTDYTFVPDTNVTINGYYYPNLQTQKQVDREEIINSTGTIEFKVNKLPDNWLTSSSTVIVDIDTDVHKNTYGVKKISATATNSYQDIVKSIYELITPKDTEDSPLKLYFNGEDINFVVTQEEADEYVNVLTEKFRQRIMEEHEGDMIKEELDNRVEEYKVTLYADLEQRLKEQKAENYIYNVVTSLLANGYQIMSLYGKGGTTIGNATARVGIIVADSLMDGKATIAIDGRLSEEKRDEIMSYLDTADPDVLSDEEVFMIEEAAEVAQNATDGIDEMERRNAEAAEQVDKRITEKVLELENPNIDVENVQDINGLMDQLSSAISGSILDEVVKPETIKNKENSLGIEDQGPVQDVTALFNTEC